MKYIKIAKEIIQMANLDQKIRKVNTAKRTHLKKLKEIDRLNLAKIKWIVKKIGCPTVTKVGKKASHFAWLLIQHADRDVKFQEYCLNLMKKTGEDNEASKVNIAFLTDRILVNKGKPQLYGTQFYESKGKLVPRPIKDADKLNERREKMDIEPFEVYKKKLLKRTVKILSS